MQFRFRETEPQVRISLDHASELSHAARSFGARTRGQARRYPGRFNRPVVGSDPDYYRRQAARVFRSTVWSDPDLSDLYRDARALSQKLHDSAIDPYAIEGPSVSAASTLANITKTISELLTAKDLTIALAGRPLDRALAISSFAIRVIGGTGSLYPGLPPTTPTNTAEYWSALEQQLARPAPPSASFPAIQ